MQRVYTTSNDDRSKLRLMSEIAIAYGGLPWFRSLSARICEGLNGYQRGLVGERLCSWVRDTIRYWREAGEQLQTPLQTLRERFGDCDDLVILAGALLASADVPWRFAYRGTPIDHIWIECQDERGKWKAFELTA